MTTPPTYPPSASLAHALARIAELEAVLIEVRPTVYDAWWRSKIDRRTLDRLDALIASAVTS